MRVHSVQHARTGNLNEAAPAAAAVIPQKTSILVESSAQIHTGGPYLIYKVQATAHKYATTAAAISTYSIKKKKHEEKKL